MTLFRFIIADTVQASYRFGRLSVPVVPVRSLQANFIKHLPGDGEGEGGSFVACAFVTFPSNFKQDFL
jgi:hypothetical protein